MAHHDQLVKLEQKGDAVTGTYGNNDQFPFKGTAKGNVLTFEFTEGQVKGDGEFTIDDTGNAFTGTFQVRNGRRGDWNGWRPDPKATTGKPAAFAGLWLTDLGLMELTQTGADVQGKYALRGTSKLEGKATGRQLEFKFNSFRSGHGWFDLSPDGKTLAAPPTPTASPVGSAGAARPAPSFVRHAPLVAGKIVDGSTQNLLTYSVHAPEGLQGRCHAKWPTVLILHGSNMNGRSYVDTIAAAWPDIARDFIILGINGETPVRLGDDPRFNYTYVNYVGNSTFKGFPGTDRESPALVSQAMYELKEVYPIDYYLVGGHSQGGFLTYSLLMNFPESMAGAFPISSGVIFQCEPDAYADEKLLRGPAKGSAGDHPRQERPGHGLRHGPVRRLAFRRSRLAGLQFFTDETAAHMFARLPVGPAIRWLEAESSKNPGQAARLCRREHQEKRIPRRDRGTQSRRHADAGCRPKAKSSPS